METTPVWNDKVRHLFVCLANMLLTGMAQAASEEFPQGLDGDIGLGGCHMRCIIRGYLDTGCLTLSYRFKQ
jgi:hypothetical protein